MPSTRHDVKAVVTREFVEREYVELGKSYLTIANELGLSRTSVEYWVKKFGLNISSRTPRKYARNDAFFRSPNTINSYFAGLLAADGWIVDSEYKVGIELQTSDRILLERFVSASGYTGPIRDRQRQQVSGHLSHMSVLQVGSAATWIKDLRENFSVTSRKTKTIQPPRLERECAESFLIGLIDGDGCISVDKKGQSRLTRLTVATSSPALADWVNEHFNRLAGTVGVRIYRQSDRGDTASVIASGSNADRIINHLSRIPVPRLQRKWKEAEEFVDLEEVS